MKIKFNNHLRKLTMSILLILVSYTAVFAKISKVHELNNKHELVMPLIKGELTPIVISGYNEINYVLPVSAPITVSFTYDQTAWCKPVAYTLNPSPIINGTTYDELEPSSNLNARYVAKPNGFSWKRIASEAGIPCTVSGTGCGIGSLLLSSDNGRISAFLSDPGEYLVTVLLKDETTLTTTITINVKPNATLTRTNKTIYDVSPSTISGTIITSQIGKTLTLTIGEYIGLSQTTTHVVNGTTTQTIDAIRGPIGRFDWEKSVSPRNLTAGSQEIYTYKLDSLEVEGS